MSANMATRSPYLHVLFVVLLVYQVITHKSAVQQRFFFFANVFTTRKTRVSAAITLPRIRPVFIRSFYFYV